MGNLILLAAMPVVTRLYSPSEFGMFAVLNGLVGIALGISSLRYEFAIPLPKSEHAAGVILLLALFLNILAVMILSAIIFFKSDDIAYILKNDMLSDVLWLLPIVLLGAGSYKALQYWAIRVHDFKAIAKTRVTQSLSNAVLQIVLGAWGVGVVGLIIAQFFGYSAGTFTLARTLQLGGFERVRRALICRMWILARRYDRFPKLDVAANLANTTSLQLPNILLASLFGPAAAGFYMLAMRVLDTPLGIIGESIGKVLYARSREAVVSGTIASMAVKIVLALAVLVTAPALVIVFVGEPVFVLFFGETWREAGVYGSWLIIGSAAQFLYYPISVVLMAIGAQDVNLYIQLFLLAIRAGAIFFGYWYGSALDAVMALAFVNTAGYLMAVAIIIWRARRHGPDDHGKGAKLPDSTIGIATGR